MSEGGPFTRVFALDLRSLAVFRVALGLTLLLDLATRAMSLRGHYTDFGVLPRRDAFRVGGAALWSLHDATGSVAGQSVLFLLAAAIAVMLVVGFHTRAATVASFVLLLSLQNRNLALFYGFDLMLRVWLMWACFLPLGSRFSVDARRSALRGAAPPADRLVSPGTFALTLQAAFVYLFSGLQKAQEPGWRDLTAMFHSLTIDNHATSWARPLALSGLDRELCVLVLVAEIAGPALLVLPALLPAWQVRARLAAMLLFSFFHIGTALLFTLGLFPLMGVVAWLPFIPGEVWDRVARWRPAWRRQGGIHVDRHPIAALGAGAVLTFVLAFNVESVMARPLITGFTRSVALALHVDQTWNMFVYPMRDGWFIARGTLADGRQVDLLRRGEPVQEDKPALVSSTFPDMRWRKLLTSLPRDAGVRYRKPLARSLCRSWNVLVTDDAERLTAVELVFMAEEEERGGVPPIVTRLSLTTLECPAPARRSQRAR